ncbi:MAG TPA: ParB/RepB/Spo0J family partition protein [Armatimonadota bacterium]|nr:ParB/RepB/Spo0J family partition protein [Armatimonadota bacterium]
MTVAEKAKTRLEDLPVERVLPTPENPRTAVVDGPGWEDFLANVTECGVLVPVHVREHPKKKGFWDLRAGERRLAAAKAAGFDTIPAIVHEGMDDADAFELTFTENFERQNLTVLEEAKAVGILLKRCRNVEAVAKKLGWPPNAVNLRVAIERRLSEKWKAAVCKPTSAVSHWPASHLELVARLPANVQDGLLGELNREHMAAVGFRKLTSELAEQMRFLRHAKWDLDAVGLVRSAPACCSCRKRSSVEPGLWHDDIATEKVTKDDRCLDLACWQAKMLAWLSGRMQELRKAHGNVGLWYGAQRVGWPWERIVRQKLNAELYEDYAYEVCKETTKGARPAMMMAGAQAGSLLWVSRGYSSRSTPARREAQGPTSLTERRTKLRRKRWARVNEQMVEKVEAAGLGDLAGDRMVTLVVLAGVFGTDAHWAFGQEASRARELLTLAGKKGGEAMQQAAGDLWEKVREHLADHILHTIDPKTKTPDWLVANIRVVGSALGLDVQEMFDEVAKTKGLTEPKGWAHLNADGTPKKAKAGGEKKLKKAVAKVCPTCVAAKKAKRAKIVRRRGGVKMQDIREAVDEVEEGRAGDA